MRREPRDLLRAIPGVEFCELADAHLCCGSAGTYNLDQPEIAASLGEKKARAVLATGAEIVASGNIGCLTQLRAHLAQLGSPRPPHHASAARRLQSCLGLIVMISLANGLSYSTWPQASTIISPASARFRG